MGGLNSAHEVVQLLLHEKAANTRGQVLCNSFSGCMSSVCCPKSIIYVYIRQRCQLQSKHTHCCLVCIHIGPLWLVSCTTVKCQPHDREMHQSAVGALHSCSRSVSSLWIRSSICMQVCRSHRSVKPAFKNAQLVEERTNRTGRVVVLYLGNICGEG